MTSESEKKRELQEKIKWAEEALRKLTLMAGGPKELERTRKRHEDFEKRERARMLTLQ